MKHKIKNRNAKILARYDKESKTYRFEIEVSAFDARILGRVLLGSGSLDQKLLDRLFPQESADESSESKIDQVQSHAGPAPTHNARARIMRTHTVRLLKSSDRDEVGGKIESRKKNGRWLIYSKWLRRAILKVRNMTKMNIRSWAYNFEKIHILDGVPIPRIRSTLKWYCKFLERNGDLIRSNPDMVPIAYTAEKFRKKFPNLEGAKARLDLAHGFEDEKPKTKKKKTRIKMTPKQVREYEKKMGWI